jgi:hypothetical protein
MAYGLQAYRRIQISNPEDTPGTAEAATEVLLGKMTVRASDEMWHKPEQDRGVLAANYEVPFQVGKEVELEFEGEFYDRLAVFMFSNAIRGNVTPTQPDDSNEPNHYLWTFQPSMTAPNTPDQTNGIDTFTLEFGDNVQGYETSHLYTVSVEITGTADEAVMASWTIRGQQIGEVTFTGALSAPAAKYFAFNNAQFFIDTSYAGIGGTQKTGMLRAFTATFETQFTGRVSADGQLYFGGLNENVKMVTLEMTYWRDDTNTEAEFDKYQAQTMTYIRIALIGDGEMDSGQSNPPYVYLDGAYRYTEWPELGEEDGTSVVTVTAESFYDATAANMMTWSVGTTMDAFA